MLAIDFALMLMAFSRHFDAWTHPAAGGTAELGSGGRVVRGADGLSMPLVVLSDLVTMLSVAANWKVQHKAKLYFGLLLVQAAAQPWFSLPGFPFFFLACELELVPVYLLIAIWGGQNRQYAATKFILYTASLLILISGLAMAWLAIPSPTSPNWHPLTGNLVSVVWASWWVR